METKEEDGGLDMLGCVISSPPPPLPPPERPFVCVSNRGVWRSLLTVVEVIGRGSQDVSEPLTCPLALSTPLSPRIDHPTAHH